VGRKRTKKQKTGFIFDGKKKTENNSKIKLWANPEKFG
jgi:hypothetical protein